MTSLVGATGLVVLVEGAASSARQPAQLEVIDRYDERVGPFPQVTFIPAPAVGAGFDLARHVPDASRDQMLAGEDRVKNRASRVETLAGIRGARRDLP